MTEWTIRALEGEPRLLWSYGTQLHDLLPDPGFIMRSAQGPLAISGERVVTPLPSRPELDMLRAALSYALQRVERELSLDGASLVFPVKPAQSDVTRE